MHCRRRIRIVLALPLVAVGWYVMTYMAVRGSDSYFDMVENEMTYRVWVGSAGLVSEPKRRTLQEAAREYRDAYLVARLLDHWPLRVYAPLAVTELILRTEWAAREKIM